MTLQNMLSTAEIADRLKVSGMTIERWIKDPEIGFPRPLQVKRRRFWPENEIAAWLEGQRVN